MDRCRGLRQDAWCGRPRPGRAPADFAYRACASSGLSLEALDGQECHLAVDLASKTDLAALVLVFPTRRSDGSLTYRVFARCYLNEAAVMEARNASYPGWAAGHLTITDGNETDFSRIEDDVLEYSGRFHVVSMAYDPWAATQFAQRLAAQNVPVIEYRANVQSFSEPTKELHAAIRAGRIEHDGNPVLEWFIGNVVAHYDARSNVYPRKSRPEQKIDAAVALIMGIGRSLVAAEAESSYNFPATRDLVNL